MDDKILSAMAADLKISKYAVESEIQYRNRILYSAMACWIKAAALDHTIGSGEKTGVSRRHIYDRCVPVLKEMLGLYPESKSWFFVESATEEPVSMIRSRLIRHGDLMNVGFDTNLILSPEGADQISDSLEVHRGTMIDPKAYYSGISVLAPCCAKEYKADEVIDSSKWLDDYLQNARWKKSEDFDGNTEYFQAAKKSKNNYACWQSEVPEIRSGVVLTRRSVNINDCEYFLMKVDEGIYVHRIDPFLKEIGEHRRFMMALRSLLHNKAPCSVITYTDHVHLKIWSFLPQAELTLLESYAWPDKNISDLCGWNMPLQVWEYIKPRFEALGLEVSEVSHG